ncbi:MAG: MATE family efflux transporter, partial [Clostridia bacterium]|nr:MATE family efflux transporter [Clostridia bacterium]
YFAGIAGLLFYNMGSGILRAVGDSRHPFYYLLVSAISNIILDLLVVFVFHMGVSGVALATVIAQLLSAVLTLITLFRTDTSVKVTLQDMKMDWTALKYILIIGCPAAIQMALTSFSNVFVQSYIAGVNGDQTAILGGWTSYSKIDQFLFLPSQSLALSITTFVGQNLGARNVARARRGIRLGILLAAAVTAPIILLVMAFAPSLAAIFNPDPGVVECATLLLHYLTPFYMFTCVNQLLASGLRGAGNSTAPMVIMLVSFVGFRQLYLFVMSTYISNDLLPVAMGYPAGWALCCLVISLYYVLHKFHLPEEIQTEETL